MTPRNSYAVNVPLFGWGSQAVMIDVLSDRGKVYRGLIPMNEFDSTDRAHLDQWVLDNGNPLTFEQATGSFPNLKRKEYPS